MRIVQVGSNSVHVTSYLEALDALGFEVHLIADESIPYGNKSSEQLVDFRSLNPLQLLKETKKVKTYLSKIQPDVIHIHQLTRMAYFVSRAAAKLNIPIVSTAWGSDVLVVPKKNAFYRFLVTKAIQRSRFITADAQSMIDAMQELVPSNEKYHWLQYGITPVEELPKEKWVYSNRLLKENYRVADIVRYFDGFVSEYSDWKLVIGAVGDQEEAVKSLVNELNLSDKVNFVGWLNKEDNHLNYGRAAIYISIPKSDGTAVSVLEAMSAGCIPVVPELPVSHEWIEDGVNGVIEKEGQNPLLEAIKLDQRRVAKLNMERVEEKATRTASMKRFIELYRISSGK